MGNRVTIEPTKFENVRSGESTYGVRVYDDHAQSYDNNWESIPDDDLEVLKLVTYCSDEAISAMMSFVQENEKGIEIGDTWYEWEQIKSIFDS